jgi:glycosyltransferase involved in cell wall biosynthesis
MATAARDARAATRASTADATARRPPKPLAPYRPTITVVVPTLNEAGNVRRAVESARACVSTSGRAPEVIVVDGGSEDDTVAEARAAGAAVLSAPRGRASQCNAGARAAKGDILLFLHADSTLPPAYDEHVVRAFGDDATNGRRHEWGAFRFALGDDNDGRGGGAPRLATQASSRASLYNLVCSSLAGPRRRLLEASVNVRTTVFRQPYGDQGLLVRKTRFDALGGFASMPFLEDVELVSRLKRGGAGAPAILNASVTTSARRFERVGYVRTSLLNQAIVLGYACGVPVERLRAWYAAARRMGGDAETR